MTSAFRAYASLLAAALLASVAASALGAQRPDSARAAAVRPAADDSLRAPLTPRRAFLYSFLVPGYSQSVLGRDKAAIGFLTFEAIAIAMIRESAADVHEARRSLNDTLVVSYGGTSGTRETVPSRFGSAELRSREAHVEDWVAVLVANHLFAGADAYVASHLWDVPARVGLRVLPRRALLLASLPW